MFGMSLNELLVLFGVILVLYKLGLWQIVTRALQELRGERVEDAPGPPRVPQGELDICYKLLGISPSTAWDEVEKAYRTKAKTHHPDHGGDGDAMRALNEAYTQIRRARGR